MERGRLGANGTTRRRSSGRAARKPGSSDPELSAARQASVHAARKPGSSGPCLRVQPVQVANGQSGPGGSWCPVLDRRLNGSAGRCGLGGRRTRWCPILGSGARRSGHVTQGQNRVMPLMADSVGQMRGQPQVRDLTPSNCHPSLAEGCMFE